MTITFCCIRFSWSLSASGSKTFCCEFVESHRSRLLHQNPLESDSDPWNHRLRCRISWSMSTSDCKTLCCHVLQCVAVCCSVLQCVAVCCSCSVLQCQMSTYDCKTFCCEFVESHLSRVLHQNFSESDADIL